MAPKWGGGLIIHHGLIIRTLRYIHTSTPLACCANIEVLRTLHKRGRFSYALNACISVGIQRNGVNFSGYLLRSMSYSVVWLTRFFIFAGFGPFSQNYPVTNYTYSLTHPWPRRPAAVPTKAQVRPLEREDEATLLEDVVRGGVAGSHVRLEQLVQRPRRHGCWDAR